jgi:ABC-type Na+ efflux pump permease subunit
MLLKKPCRVPVLSMYTFLLPALLPASSEVCSKAALYHRHLISTLVLSFLFVFLICWLVLQETGISTGK